MATKITGTNTAAAPGVTGDDTDTGLFYGTNEIGFSTGGTSRLTLDSSGHLKFPDSGKIRLGTGNDLDIFHNSNINYIHSNNAVPLRITTGAETQAVFTANGSVDLYFDNTKRFETKSDGVDITGELQCDSLDVDGAAEFTGADVTFYGASTNAYWDQSTNRLTFEDDTMAAFGSGQDLVIYHDGSNSYLGNATGDIIIENSGGNTSNQIYIRGKTGVDSIRVDGNGATYIYDQSTGSAVKRFETTSSGASITGVLGFANTGQCISLGDDKEINFGSGDDLRIYHDGTRSWVRDSGSGNLIIDTNGSEIDINSGGNAEYMARFIKDGSVELYHNNIKTFNTASSGIEIRGPESGNCEFYMYADEGDDNADLWKFVADTGGDFTIQNKASGSWAEKLRIAADGKVGIGETSPSVLLNLKGTADGGATGIKIIADADTYSQLTLDGNRSSAGNACGIIAGRWNANDVCSIYLISGSDTTNKDDGQLGFYTTPSGGSSSRRLLLNENGVWYGSLYDTNTNAGLSANVFVFSNDSMGRASSSGKYKKNIETIQDSYADKILTMRPTWYQQDETTVNIQEDQGDNWGYWGFIAEEVAAIDPRLVTWKVANYTTDPSDQTKTIRTPLSEPEPDNVAYDRFVPHLVNLLKRQATKIETLETKVATLEAG